MKEQELRSLEREWWPEDLPFSADDVIVSIEGLSEPLDMTDEPWWKRLWFKILRIT